MRLKSLTHLETETIENECLELEKKIAYYEEVLTSSKRQYSIVKEELIEIKKRMATGRTSTILGVEEAKEAEVIVPTAEESIAYKDGILILDGDGMIKLISQRSYSLGIKNQDSYNHKNLPMQALLVNNKGTTFAFTNLGNFVKININDLPDKKWSDKGGVVNQINREGKPGEFFVKIIFFPSTPVGQFVFFTRGGYVKLSNVSEYIDTKPYSLATIVQDKDTLINVELIEEGKNILEVTALGQSLVYDISDVPLQGRKAGGVRGIKLNDGDYVIYGGQIEEEGEVIVATSGGNIKRVIAALLDIASRYQKGVKIAELDVNSNIAWVGFVKMPYDIAIVSSDEQVSVINTETIDIDARTTKGKKLIKKGILNIFSLENMDI